MGHGLGPLIHVVDPEEAPGSWLWISSAPAVVALWGVTHWIKDLSVSLSPSLSPSLSLSLLPLSLLSLCQ